MDIKVFFILGLTGFASCRLPFRRTCNDAVDTNSATAPNSCSNYKNIEHIYNEIATLKNQGKEGRELTANLTEKINNFQNVVDQLNELRAAVNNKVAFSATIIERPGVFTGPRTGSSPPVLIFNQVFTNIGNAYNRNTGIFTAPVRGVYQFTFMTFGYNTHTSGAILVKNGRYQVSTWEFKGPDASDTTSNTVVLQLNPSDCINIILWQGGKIHTGVFSGFLLFTV